MREIVTEAAKRAQDMCGASSLETQFMCDELLAELHGTNLNYEGNCHPCDPFHHPWSGTALDTHHEMQSDETNGGALRTEQRLLPASKILE